MSLAIGSRLGPYEVLDPIGAGGMGEVYKARDTRLDRTVAIKVLPEELAADAQRRARFEHEARTIATLNHPHICTLHDVGEQAGRAYLVMEYLAGETLARRLEHGPLPLDQVLRLGAQIGEALGAAHRHGIVHRDLKPANVMLTRGLSARQGLPQVKLLDFGLAKLRPGEGVSVLSQGSSAATRTGGMTTVGALVGTLTYMAPEQIEGREVDARADIWALGCLLYEMLTGHRAFTGATTGSLVGAILAREPEPLALRQPVTPPSLDRLVRRCLAKDPEERWDSARDVADALRWIAQAETSGVAPAAVAAPRRRAWGRAVALAAFAVAMVAVGAGATWWLRVPPVPAIARPSLDVSPAEELNAGGLSTRFLPTPGGARTSLTWTPDGRALVFVGRRAGTQQLFVRRLDAAEAQPLANTDGAQVPAVSPDGQAVVFWARGSIRRVSLAGGPVTELAAAISPPPQGLVCDDWSRVFYAHDRRIWMIGAEGVPTAVTVLGDAERSHALPWVLPGGRVLIFTVRKRNWSWGDEEVVAQPLDSGTRTTLLKDAADARYVPTGHLVFMRRGALMAVAFDAERLQVQGAPVAMLDAVAQSLTASLSTDLTGAGQFAVSPTGALAWLPSPVRPPPDRVLVTLDRRGRVTPLPAPPRSYAFTLPVSPDGQHLAVAVQTQSEVGLWIFDLTRGLLSPVTREGEVNAAVWSPDGTRLVYSRLADGRSALIEQAADGATPPRVLLEGFVEPGSFTPDGRHLAAVRAAQDIQDLLVESGTTATVQPLVETPATEGWPAFSPDGRWLAYVSNASGRNEVYVRPYPGPGTTEPASLDGGVSPAWHPNGRELFFIGLPGADGQRQMMAASFIPGLPARAGAGRADAPRLGRPTPLFTYDPREFSLTCIPVRCYDVAPDGEHFYAIRTPQQPASPVVTHVNLAMRWFEELVARVPVRR